MKVLPVALAIFVCTASAAYAEDRPIRGLRETVGTIQINGWEQGLVNNQPNLSHWHWTPIYANVQRIRGYGDPPPRQQPDKQPVIPVSHYVKPIHAPMPQVDHSQMPIIHQPSKPLAIDGSSRWVGHSGNSPGNSNDHVSAKIVPKLPVAQTPPTVASRI
jgi:hypothetical protein